MRRRLSVLIASGIAASLVAASSPARVRAADAASTQQDLLRRYCITCHNQNLKRRGTVPVAFDDLPLSDLGAHADVWERVVRQVRGGLMPPAGRARPDRETMNGFAAWLEDGLDRYSAAYPDPGRTQPLHRLNRAEYANAVRDLLGLSVDVSSLLPSDDASYGFDNIAGVLKMSPTLMERYLAAAQKVSRLAVGTPPPFPNVDAVRLRDDLQQDERVDGLPVGTRGGVSLDYHFPMDAEYVVKVRLARDILENVPVFREDQQLEVTLDGTQIRVFTVPGYAPKPVAPAPAKAAAGDAKASAGRGARPQPQISQVDTGPRLSREERAARNRIDDHWDVRMRVAAGDHRLNVAFLKLDAALAETARLPFVKPYAANVNVPDNRMGDALRSVEIAGPYNPSGAGDSASRRKIFVCRPATAANETACARTILTTLARRAYRRPVADADVQPLLAMYEEGRQAGDFDAGIERAVKRLLVSPEFLFRVERDPAHAVAGTPYRITDVELASRLSFFLWSSIPDDELLTVAARNRLHEPAVLEQQVRRMVADPRAEAFVTNFAGQWLYLRNLDAINPVSFDFPDFDAALRNSMQRETELFFQSIVREDRGALELLTADYTFLDERLARHYGIAGVKGTEFRRVELPAGSMRRGLLGQASILTVTSHPDRTSPIVRGKWILENLLGTPPPPPPPNVPELKSTGTAGAVLSMRARMTAHRANPACAGCHAMMDPIGFSLERFDAVGKARTLGEDAGPIDASGALPDGATFTGADGLRAALLAHPDRIVTTIAEKLLTYAIGRGVEYYDEPAVRGIVRAAAQRDYRFTTGLILGVVQSAPFQMRMPAPRAAHEQSKVASNVPHE